MIRNNIGLLLFRNYTNLNLNVGKKRSSSNGFNSEISTFYSINNNNPFNLTTFILNNFQNIDSSYQKDKMLYPLISNNKIKLKKNKILKSNSQKRILLNDFFIKPESQFKGDKKANFTLKNFYEKIKYTVFRQKEFEILDKQYNFYKKKNKKIDKLDSYKKKYIPIYSNFIDNDLLEPIMKKSKEYYFKYSLKKPNKIVNYNN